MGLEESFCRIRSDFLQLQEEVHGQPLVYLDSAATSLKPKAVVDSLQEHYLRASSNVHRGIHFFSSQATQQYEAAREKVKKFIGVSELGEIIFTKGTTEAVNLVAHSWGENELKPGDIILLSQMEHHSNIVPWQLVAEKTGAVIKVIPIDQRGEIRLDEYKKLLRESVRIVGLAHASNTLGTVNPVKEMTALAHKHGALVLLDSAQSVPHMPLSVSDLDCDFLAFSGHKMCAPTGIGVLYGKKELLSKMPPYQGGGGMIEEVTFAKTTYRNPPEKFEAGTPPIAQVVGLGVAMDYLGGIGLSKIAAWEKELLEKATREVEQVSGVRIIGKAENKIGVLSFVVEGFHSQDIGMILDRQGVALRVGHHCTAPLLQYFGLNATLRASFAFYNTFEDVTIFVNALKKAKEMLR